MGCRCKKSADKFKQMVRAAIPLQSPIIPVKTWRQLRIEARDVRCKARAERIRRRNEAIIKQREEKINENQKK